jgi:hypothetical protein
MLWNLPGTTQPVSAEALLKAERDRIRERRNELNRKAGATVVAVGEPADDAIGLALSGGGIRSATFNLGLLQSLSRRDLLPLIDYLSTVSGGGYIGSSLTWFMSALGRPFPFGTHRLDNLDAAGEVVAKLRERGNYLTPGQGLNGWALAAAVLSGTLVNVLVLVPIFMLAIYLLSRPPLGYDWRVVMAASVALLVVALLRLRVSAGTRQSSVDRGPRWSDWAAGLGILGFVVALGAPAHSWLLQRRFPGIDHVFGQAFCVGIAALALYLLHSILYAIVARWSVLRSFLAQQVIDRSAGRLLMFGTGFLVVGSIPLVYDMLSSGRLHDWLHAAMSSITVGGALSVAGALWGRAKGSELRGLRAFFISAGLTLAIYGLFLWFYHLLHGAQPFVPIHWLIAALFVSALIGLFGNINYVSMHRFYRNRLMEAYMPEVPGVATRANADRCMLRDIPQTDAPYHLINTNVQLTGSEVPKYRARAGDSFLLSPLFCGASCMGFMPTQSYLGGSMNLATALAISGAAVDPNTYLTRSRPLTFLMTLLNVRLGYWASNPRYAARAGMNPGTPGYYWYIFKELFSGLDERSRHIHLSDGGHFENLGLYELVRRRCRVIIVSDAAADPERGFADLGRAIELVRLDFGAKIEIDIDALVPRGEEGKSAKAFVTGSVLYPVRPGETKPSSGTLIYVKTSLIDGLSEDIKAYHCQDASFPNDTTADQFFDEGQFEAYRELGYQIGDALWKAYPPGKLAELKQ